MRVAPPFDFFLSLFQPAAPRLGSLAVSLACDEGRVSDVGRCRGLVFTDTKEINIRQKKKARPIGDELSADHDIGQ